jgi:hypothetical protein
MSMLSAPAVRCSSHKSTERPGISCLPGSGPPARMECTAVSHSGGFPPTHRVAGHTFKGKPLR